MRFHPNGSYLATGSCDKTVRLWTVQDGKAVRLFHGHRGTIHTLAFSPNGQYLASAGEDRRVKVHPSICMSVCLCLFVGPSIHLYVSVYMSVCLSVDLSIHLYVCLYACLSVDPSIHLYVCLFICLYVHPSILVSCSLTCLVVRYLVLFVFSAFLYYSHASHLFVL